MPSSDIYARSIDEQPASATCPDCAGSVLENCTERTCESCGLVVADVPVDRGPEWRTLDGEPSKEPRTGAPRTSARHDHGLGSQVGTYRDGTGDILSGARRQTFARLRQEQGQTRRGATIERNQMYGMMDIRRLSGALGLPDSVRDRACTIFRQAHQADLLRGRSTEAVAAASVYAACRDRDLPRTQAEIEPIAGCDRSALRNPLGALNAELGLELRPLKSSAFIPRVAAAADAPPGIRRQALAIARAAEREGLIYGRQPFGVAAACVELADEAGAVTQQELAAIANVSPTSVRSAREQLREHLDMDAISSGD